MDFDYPNSTYFHMFGLSQLNSFLETRPEDRAVRIKWKVRRFISYFFASFYLPGWLAIQLLGIAFGRKGEVDEIAFTIAYTSYIIQLIVKLNYFLYKIRDFRELCLRFERFHTSKHRPDFSKTILTETSDSLRSKASIYNGVMYANLLLWNVTPLLVQPAKVVLHSLGYVNNPSASLVPDIFPVVYFFDEKSSWYLSLLTGCLEWIVVNAGLVYGFALEVFFMSIFLMLASEIDVICKSAESSGELATAIDRDYISCLGPLDSRERMDFKLIIDDHQFVLEKVKRLSKIMNPIFGISICYCLVLMPNLCVITTKTIRSAESAVAAARDSLRWIAASFGVLLALFLFSWICGKLKDSEEGVFRAVYSTDWYQQGKSYRDNVLVVMGTSFRPREMRMMSCGVLDRETFIAGLKAVYSFYNFVIGLD